MNRLILLLLVLVAGVASATLITIAGSPGVSAGGGGGSPAPGCEDPPATELADVACAMSAGSWVELTTTNIGVLNSGTSNQNMLPYAGEGTWDPIHGVVQVVGQDHSQPEVCGGGPPDCLRHVRYTESTNAWTLVDSDIGQAGHMYDHHVVDPSNGDMYFVRYGADQIEKCAWDCGGAWTLGFETIPSIANITMGVAFWTGALAGIDGGAGAILLQEPAFGQILVYDVGDDDWPIQDATLPGIEPDTGQYQSQCVYSSMFNYAICGGNSNEDANGYMGVPWPRVLFRINDDASWDQIANLPANASIGQQGGQGIATYEPVTGKFILLSQGSIWEIDGTGSGTYTELTGTCAVPAAVNSPGAVASQNVTLVTIDTYEVVMAISVDGAGTGNVYLYKHGEGAC